MHYQNIVGMVFNFAAMCHDYHSEHLAGNGAKCADRQLQAQDNLYTLSS